MYLINDDNTFLYICKTTILRQTHVQLCYSTGQKKKVLNVTTQTEIETLTVDGYYTFRKMVQYQMLSV